MRWPFFNKTKIRKDSPKWDPNSGEFNFDSLRRRDALTNLPNRKSLVDHLEQLMPMAKRKQIPGIAVIFFDLDRFRKVSTGMGYHASDQLLHAVANRMKEGLEENEFLGRFAGDQFVLISSESESVRQAVTIADRVRNQMRAPFVVAGVELFVTVSAGVSIWNSTYTHAEELIRDADIATVHSRKKVMRSSRFSTRIGISRVWVGFNFKMSFDAH